MTEEEEGTRPTPDSGGMDEEIEVPTVEEQQQLIRDDRRLHLHRGLGFHDNAVSDPRGLRKLWAPVAVLLCALLGVIFYFVERPGPDDVDRLSPLEGPGFRAVTHPTILISIDGFRHEYLSRKVKGSGGREVLLAPTLNAIARDGVHAARGMQPVVPTKTFPNHWSLVTGLYPESSGILDNTMFDPLTEKWFHLDHTHPEWWYGTPIWQTLRQTARVAVNSNNTQVRLDQNYSTACVFWPGSDVPKHAPNAFWKYDGRVSYQRRVQRAIELLSGRAHDLDGQADFVTLYFQGVDHEGHKNGPYSPEVAAEIQKVDKAVASLLHLLGENATESYNVIVVSDHGMTEISPERTIDLESNIPAGKAQDIVTSPMGMFLNISIGADELYRKIKGKFDTEDQKATVYYKEDLPKRWHIGDSRLVTEVVTMATLGWTVAYPHQHLVPDTHTPLGRTVVRSETEKGNHGYDNTYDDMQAIFLAQGPAFKAGSTVNNLRSIDVYEMLCYIFGAEPASNNGTIDVTLASVLKENSYAASEK